MNLSLAPCTVTRNGIKLLHLPALELTAPNLVVVIGRNGAGKTTLLNHIRRPAQSTSVWLDDRDVHHLSGREAAQKIAWLPQFWPADIDMSVAAFVLYGSYPWERNPGLNQQDRTMACLGEVGIEALAERSMATLSGGERQRAALAAILMQNAPVWLLDEPFSALDLPGELALWELLRTSAAKRNALVLVCAHGLNLALRHADRVLVLHEAELLFDGVPTALPDSPAAHLLTGDRFVWHTENGLPMVQPR